MNRIYRRIATIAGCLLLASCAGNNPDSVDMKDCTSKTINVGEIQGRGRRAPYYINIIDDAGQSYRTDDSLLGNGKAIIRTCKTYLKDTTLYAGEATVIELIDFSSTPD